MIIRFSIFLGRKRDRHLCAREVKLFRVFAIKDGELTLSRHKKD